MEQLPQDVESPSDEPDSIGPSTSPVSRRHEIPNEEQIDGTAVLELVHQAAELIRGMDIRASDTDARAQVLFQQTIEDLKFAKHRVQSAEAQREAASAALVAANSQAQEMENAMREAEILLASDEVQLSKIEVRANASEARATELERALRQIEDAIRNRLLDSRSEVSRVLAAAA